MRRGGLRGPGVLVCGPYALACAPSLADALAMAVVACRSCQLPCQRVRLRPLWLPTVVRMPMLPLRLSRKRLCDDGDAGYNDDGEA